MSAKRSTATKILKRAGRQAEQYQAAIDRQKHMIDRLGAAVAVYGDLAYAVENDAKSIVEARKLAKEALAKVQTILAVPNQGGGTSGK